MMHRAGRALARCPGFVLPLLLLTAQVTAQLDADFTATPLSGTNPQVVSFTDLTTGGTPVSWAWSFGDGGFSSGQNPMHLFAGPGTFTVGLTVFGSGGGFDVETKAAYITVAPAPLDVKFVANPSTGLGSLEVAFTNTTSGGPVDSWSWSFGDGQTSTEKHPTHVYDEPGSYTVSLTASIGLQQETHVETDFVTVAAVFGEQVLITTAVADARAMVSADLDRDGDEDLITASATDTQNAWFENLDGGGSFGPKHLITDTFSLFGGPRDLAVADIDRDGWPDVVVCDRVKLATFRNLGVSGAGSTSFGPPTTFAQPGTTGFVSVDTADVDGDGDRDVLGADESADKVGWYANTDGAGSFGPEAVISTDEDFVRRVIAADLDGDGDQDAVTAARNDNALSWYENTDGAGAFGARRFITQVASSPLDMEAVDLDGDGDLDLLAVIRDLVWYENLDGAGSFGPAQVLDDLVTWADASAADFDCDGDLDVMAAGNRLAWYENTDGSGTFAPGPQHFVSEINQGDSLLLLADMDRDGDVDAVGSSNTNDQIRWWPNVFAPSPWTDLGGASVGSQGVPALLAKGTLEAGAPFSLSIDQAPPTVLLLIWLSFTSTPVEVIGGTLHANPFSAQFLRATDGDGEWSQTAPWPLGIPADVDFWLQGIVQDPGVPAGLTLTDAWTATTP